MPLHLRSTYERLLARHRLKRTTPLVDISSLSPDSIPSDPFSTIPPVSSTDIPDVPVFEPPIPSPKPVESVLPPAPIISAGHPDTPSLTPSTTTVFVTPSPSLVSATPSSSVVTPTHIPSSDSPTVNASVTSRPASSVASDTADHSHSSHGPSGGVIGALVTIAVIIMVAVVAFFVRKQHQRRRTLKRNTWGAGLIPSLENKRDTVYGGQPIGVQTHRLPNVPMTSEVSQAQVTQSLAAIPPPVSSYNPAHPPSFAATSIRSVAPSVSSVRSAPPAEFAIVARTFIPSLPDELHIANGEQIQIINAYDDGWALCLNLRGEQGVVPLECLEKIVGAPALPELQQQSQGQDANRTSRRMSSLTPNAAETY